MIKTENWEQYPISQELISDLEEIGIRLELECIDNESFENVVKTTCFLSDMEDFGTFNEVYGKYFVNKPARSCVAVKTLPKNVLCEVEVIAVVQQG